MFVNIAITGNFIMIQLKPAETQLYYGNITLSRCLVLKMVDVPTSTHRIRDANSRFPMADFDVLLTNTLKK